MSGGEGLLSRWISMFVTGSFLVNSRKPPWGFMPLLATMESLNLLKGLDDCSDKMLRITYESED